MLFKNIYYFKKVVNSYIKKQFSSPEVLVQQVKVLICEKLFPTNFSSLIFISVTVLSKNIYKH